MWGVYDYDLPSDLGARLLNAGFVESGSSTVMIGESSSHGLEDPTLPEGAELVHVRDAAGVNSSSPFTRVSLLTTSKICAGRSFVVCK